MTISVANKFAEDGSASGDSASTVDGDGGSCLMNPLVDDGSTKDDSINSEHHDHDSDDSYQLVSPSTTTKGSSPPELVQKGRNNEILKKSEAIKRARQWAENRRRATEASSRSRRAETAGGSSVNADDEVITRRADAAAQEPGGWQRPVSITLPLWSVAFIGILFLVVFVTMMVALSIASILLLGGARNGQGAPMGMINMFGHMQVERVPNEIPNDIRVDIKSSTFNIDSSTLPDLLDAISSEVQRQVKSQRLDEKGNKGENKKQQVKSQRVGEKGSKGEKKQQQKKNEQKDKRQQKNKRGKMKKEKQEMTTKQKNSTKAENQDGKEMKQSILPWGKREITKSRDRCGGEPVPEDVKIYTPEDLWKDYGDDEKQEEETNEETEKKIEKVGGMQIFVKRLTGETIAYVINCFFE